MLPRLRRNIALRTTLTIIAVVSAVGLGVISVAGKVLSERAQAQYQQSITDLLTTVDNTLRLAVFLEDAILAEEVARGLAGNALIDKVAIYAGDTLLAGAPKIASDSTSRVSLLHSPFDSADPVGRVVVLPDHEAMAVLLYGQLRFAGVLFLSLLAATAVSAALAVLFLVVHPIARISSRLHRLNIETGEQVPAPASHREDELGRLVDDINRILNRLVDRLGRERSERNLREREERRLRAILNNAQSGIFQLDIGGHVVSWNPAFVRLFQGSSTRDDEKAEPASILLSELPRDAATAMLSLLNRVSDEQREVHGEIPVELATGLRWISVTLTPLSPGQYQGIANDVTEQRQAQQAAETLALTDPLTGCLNRLGFNQALEQQAAQHAEGDWQHVLMLDLDLFKAANDQYGHDAGDEVLRAVARRIQRQLKSGDCVARLGGDEFAVLLPGEVSSERLTAVAGHIIEAVNRPIAVGEHRIHVGASIGIASGRLGTVSGAALLKHADEAMYRAKREGRNRYCVAEN
tara:strand:- start:199141 stop:200706 length:1566 start_codon:yes stop_codon:yes gene_type:complete